MFKLFDYTTDMSRGKRFKGHRWSKPRPCRNKIFSFHPVKTLLKPSSIPGAGLGLFLIQNVRKHQRIAVYTGKELSSDQVSQSSSQYIVRISKNVFLDGNGLHEQGLGKYINCGWKSKRTINARLASGTTYNFNKKFNVKWISVFATRNIQASVEHPVEILINYGTEYWNRIRIMKSMTFVTSFVTSVDLDNGKEYWL